MKVTLIGQTSFNPPPHVVWKPDESNVYDNDRNWDGISLREYDGSALVEFAGRACYQSWNRPNPKTATNAGYLRNILDVGHFSVLEHASATFYVEGVSRSLTHELVRHRHLSFSQLSQRFVDESDVNTVLPPALAALDKEEIIDQLLEINNAVASIHFAYETIVQLLRERGLTRKQAREAARCVLPNMTETKIVVTGNYRAWRHFINLRATVQADAEIRELALLILSSLSGIAPNVFGDYRIVDVPVRHAWSTLDTRDE